MTPVRMSTEEMLKMVSVAVDKYRSEESKWREYEKWAPTHPFRVIRQEEAKYREAADKAQAIADALTQLLAEYREMREALQTIANGLDGPDDFETVEWVKRIVAEAIPREEGEQVKAALAGGASTTKPKRVTIHIDEGEEHHG